MITASLEGGFSSSTPALGGTPAPGLPQSSASPLVAEFNRPWAEQEAERMRSAERAYLEKLDSALLDPEGFFKNHPLPPNPFSDDQEADRRGFVVHGYLRLKTGKADLSADAADLYRASIAHEEFGGKGALDADEFHGELVKDATKRRDKRQIQGAIAAAAQDDFLLPEGSQPGFSAVRQGIKARPGYDPADDADNYDTFISAREAAAEQLAPIKDQLNAAWNAAIKGEGVPRDVLESVPDEQWVPFLSGLRLRAQTLPDTERESFLAGMRKDFSRSLEGFGRNAADVIAEGGMIAEPLDGTVLPGDLADWRKATAAAMKKGKNRAAEARRILHAEYDPINYVEGLGWLQKAPGVTVTSLSMAVPVLGPATMAASMMGAAQESTYLRLRDGGMNEADAGEISNAIAPAIMMPQMALERIGYGAWGRKIPWMSDAIEAVGNRITNRAARLLVKGGVITGIEGTTEVLQDFTEFAVQDIAAEFSPHVPDVDLMKEFKGAWREFPEIAGSMIFLSLFGAAGGLNAEARAAAWAASTPRQQAAAGLTPEAIARIEAAKVRGPSSLLATVTEEWATRDPNSPEAAAAAAEEAAAVKSQQAAIESAKASGMVPEIVGNARDGYTVLDGDTKEEVGTAPDIAGAMRLASAHSAALDERNAEKTAYLTGLLEASEEALAMAGDANANTSAELGTAYTEAVAAAEDPASIDQFAAQAADKEVINGGTGKVSQVALGRNVAETRGMVRTFTNRLFQGASVRTVVHETGHGMLRRAWEAGAITREETFQVVQAINAAMQGRKLKKGAFAGESLNLLDETAYAAADAAGKDRMLHEAVAEIMEAEVMRTRKRDKSAKSLPMSKGVITRGVFSAALLRMSPKLAGKFKALVEAVRGVVGLSSARALAMKKAIREGTLKEADIEAFMGKLTGRDHQAEHDGMVRDEAAQLLGLEAFTPTDDAPFSLGRATVTPTASTQVLAGDADSPSVIGPAYFSLSAWHGTPHKVDKFTTAKIGTGEGSQAYGWGLYFAAAKEVAKHYANFISARSTDHTDPRNLARFAKGVNPSNSAEDGVYYLKSVINFANKMPNTYREEPGGADGVKTRAEAAIDILNSGQDLDEGGNLYRVTLKVKDEDLLDWDKPLSEQSEKVRAFVNQLESTPRSKTGSVIYLRIGDYAKGNIMTGERDQRVSAILADAGIRGIRYLDGDSRNSGEGSYNYVIFDENDIEIVEENGTPVKIGEFSLAPARDAEYLALAKDPEKNREALQKMVDEAAKKAGLEIIEGNDSVDPDYLEPVNEIYPGRERHVAAMAREFAKSGQWNGRPILKIGDRALTGSHRIFAARRANEILRRAGRDEIEVPTYELSDDAAEMFDQWIQEDGAYETNAIDYASFNSSVGDDTDKASTAKAALKAGVIPLEFEALLRAEEMSNWGNDFERFKGQIYASPSQIKSADPVTYDESGNVIPLSQRFDSSKDSINYSLAPASMVDSMAMNVISRIKDPRVKAAMFTRMLEKLGELKRDKDEFGVAFGKGYKRKAIQYPRKVASIRKESAMREALRSDELVDEAHARHGGILHGDDFSKLWNNPVWSHFAKPDDRLHGRLMSFSKWRRRNPGENYGGIYDGSGDLPRVLFGGELAPDLAAQELYGAGLIKSPTPDAMWEALKREAAGVEKIKQAMSAAKEDVRKAKLQAKEEATAWENERLKEEAANYSPRQRLLRALAMLDAILAVLPPEVRGRIGGYTQLAKLGSDEARLKFLNERIAKAETEIDAWIKGEHRKELSKLIEKSKPKKNAPGEAKRGKIGVDAHRIFAWVTKYAPMDETQVDAERIAIENERERLADESVPGIVHPDMQELSNRERALDLVGGFEDKTTADQAAALAWLRNTYTFGRDEWQAKEGERLAEIARLQRVVIEELARQKGVTLPSFEMPKFDNRKINGMTADEAEPLLRDHDTRVRNALAKHKAALRKALEEGGVGSLAARQDRERTEQGAEARTMLEAGSGEFISFVQTMERLLGVGHPLVTRWNTAIGEAQMQKTEALLAADAAWLEAASEALGNPGRLKAQERLWAMSAEQSVTIEKQIRETGAEMEIRISNVPGLLDGTLDPADFELTADDLPALREAWDAHQAVDRKGRADTTEFLKFQTVGERTTQQVKLTPMQAITLILTGRMARYSKNLEIHGFTADVLASAAAQVGPEGMSMADWLGEYYERNYEPLAKVFRDMFGIDLPKETNYSPFRAERGGTDKDIGGPQEAGMVPEGGFRANMLKTRAPSHQLAPALMGAVSVFQGHVAVSEHWKAFAPLVREMKAVLSGLETRHAIEAVHGKHLVRALDGWLLAFEQNGLKQRKMHDGVDRMIRGMQRNIAVLGLAFRVSTIVKNYLLPAFGSARRIGLLNWTRGLARVASGKVDYRRFRESRVITLREQAGFSPEMKLAASRLLSDKPSNTRNAVIWAMEQIAIADARSTAISAAISWDFHFRENAKTMEADEAVAVAEIQMTDDVRRTAQPLELAERSLYELSSSEAGRLLFLFATDARKETAIFAEAMRRAWKENGAKGLLTNEEFRMAATAIWMTTGLLNTVISRALMDSMDGGDDDEWFDEKNWSVTSLLYSTLLGPVGGIPLLRDLVSGLSQGEMTKPIRGAQAAGNLLEAAWECEIPDKDRAMWIERQINKILIGAGLFNRAAAEIGAFSNIVDQSARIITNATKD